MTGDKCLIIVVHQIQVLCFFLCLSRSLCYVSRDNVFTGNAFTSHDLCTYSVLFFIRLCALWQSPIVQHYIIEIVSKSSTSNLAVRSIRRFVPFDAWRTVLVQHQKKCELFPTYRIVIADRIQRRSKITDTKRLHVMLYQWPPLLPRRLSLAALVQTCSLPPMPPVEAQWAEGRS